MPIDFFKVSLVQVVVPLIVDARVNTFFVLCSKRDPGLLLALVYNINDLAYNIMII